MPRKPLYLKVPPFQATDILRQFMAWLTCLSGSETPSSKDPYGVSIYTVGVLWDKGS